MAVQRNSEKRTATILVDNGVSDSGKQITKSISFSNINPSAAPAALFAALEALGSLMQPAIVRYEVTDKDVLVDHAE